MCQLISCTPMIVGVAEQSARDLSDVPAHDASIQTGEDVASGFSDVPAHDVSQLDSGGELGEDRVTTEVERVALLYSRPGVLLNHLPESYVMRCLLYVRKRRALRCRGQTAFG